ncbi:S-adenosyl-L-methionine-dependent methyltransferase [Diplogelasinospora grovesii]|uniref:S-adenosyl-L-methionine-dependent methyltransferase n=1 Tax=Diplogelasinospora grovesii TaxID=303347 RepID=A0AAN6NE94_9PEZI|nr:S-adenosyl-L-methionine-dependent methyltransferase [Diplogelasinospora grovesii]
MDSSAQAGAFGVGAAAAAAINMGPDEPLAGSQEEGRDDELVSGPGHIPMAQRLSLESWGSGSMPSMPDVDDNSGIDVFGSESGSSRYSTTSVESSIYHYIEENGRTYHRFKEGKYPLPNDQQEQDRLDLQHALFVITTHGKLFLAPIGEDVRNILDIATGTGVWAIEIAQQFPNAHVIGTDLSPIQPQYVPANCHFEIDDAEDEWTFSTKFDYIHGRALLSCFKDPSAVIRQACDALAPGGYLEFQDGVFPMQFAGDGAPANCALRRWNELVLEGAARTGRPWTNTQHYKRCFEEAGLENVVERRFYWPVSPWAKGKYYKTVATFFREDMLSGLDAASLKILGALGWSVDAIRDFLLEVRKDFHDPSINAYLQIAFVYGRKPGSVV